MRFSDILLVIVSSAGLLHGVLFACYLIFFKKKKSLANTLLGSVLIFMAFRIGKSVMLNFGEGLEPVFIFIGLGFLLVIGPLLSWYFRSMTRPNFRIRKNDLLEFVPFIVFFVASLFVTENWFENSEWVIVVFSSALIFIYLHFAFYIAASWREYKRAARPITEPGRTRSQESVLRWLRMVLIGIVLIWISYVLNILDETVPYVIGPIMYSIAIYYLSVKAYQLRVTDLDGSVFEDSGNEVLFKKVSEMITIEKMYLEPDLSLSKLSSSLGKSNQQVSAAINQHSGRNFNDFINFYRVQEAKRLLSDNSNEKFTISSIAFDTGFSSLSSFNSAFKKFEGATPSNFRKGKRV